MTQQKTNQTLNYATVQRTANNFAVSVDVERTLFKASSPQHNTKDTLELMLMSAFEPRCKTVVDIARAKGFTQLQNTQQIAQMDPFLDAN